MVLSKLNLTDLLRDFPALFNHNVDLTALKSELISQAELNVIRDNIILNAFRFAILDGVSAPLNYEYFSLDEYETEEKIDKVNSVNQFYEAVGNYYKPTGAYATYLKFWSKLESNADVISPQIGPAGIVDGSPTYEPCKFGNGLYSNSDTNGAHFPNSFNMRYKGTIEGWIKTDWSKTGGTISDNDHHEAIELRDTATSSGVVLFAGYPGRGVVAAAWGADGSWVEIWDDITNWVIGDLVHIAMVWDQNAGFDGAKTMALYVNGTEIVSTTEALNIPDLSAADWHIARFSGGDHTLDGIIDNGKVFNYCKIDFSDRNTEETAVEYDSMSLVSKNVVADFEPSEARKVIRIEPMEEIILNTDLEVWVTKEGADFGTATWEQVIVESMGEFGSLKTVIKGTKAMAVTGTKDMRYMIKTLNNKNIRIHGDAFQLKE